MVRVVPTRRRSGPVHVTLVITLAQRGQDFASASTSNSCAGVSQFDGVGEPERSGLGGAHLDALAGMHRRHAALLVASLDGRRRDDDDGTRILRRCN
jgi:hypothetical protein